jgi:ABC-type amino acid transport substrate-binding protein
MRSPRLAHALLVVAWLAPQHLRADAYAEAKARGTLRVIAVAIDQKDEFFSSRPGDAPGFDRELLEAYCTREKLRLEVVPVSGWDGLVPALQAGKGELIAGRFSVTDKRRRLIDFTADVFPTRTVVVTRKPTRVIQTVDELRAERVGTVRGSSLAEAVDAAAVPRTNVDDSIQPGHLADALKTGKVTAVIQGVEDAILSQREDPELQLGLFVGPPGSLAWGVRKGETALLQSLNHHIAGVRKSPTWSRLVVKYFGESALEVLKKARAE